MSQVLQLSTLILPVFCASALIISLFGSARLLILGFVLITPLTSAAFLTGPF